MCARANTCNLLDATRSGMPASVAVADFEVGNYGQYHYGDIELVWSNQGGALSFSSVRDLSNGVDIPFNDVFGTEGWGFAAETGLGALEEAVTDATIPRTAAGKVLYPDPNFTFLGGQNSSFAGAEQGAPHYTDLPFDPDVFDKIDEFPGFPSFQAPFMQRGAFQQTAALFTCPAAGGGFGCAGAGAGKQGTRLWIVGSYLDMSFNQLPADGETWIIQLGSASAGTARPPVPGSIVSVPLSGGSNDPASADLAAILVVPNPFIAQNEITRGKGLQRILFTNMPPRATVRIYTISGNLVRVLEHTNESGTLEWDVRTRFDLFVASGNYYFHVTLPDGRTSLGRFAVIN
jgi:hypothetical protein